MKAVINIECTPAEARAFLGLPDVEPIQAAVMERLQEHIVSEIDRFSPEALMTQWLSAFPENGSRGGPRSRGARARARRSGRAPGLVARAGAEGRVYVSPARLPESGCGGGTSAHADAARRRDPRDRLGR